VAEGLNVVDPLERFRLDYAPLLLRYLSRRDEAGLKLAYDLGRDAMRESVSLLDVIRVHHELFLDVLATVRDVAEAQSIARSASTLLLDLIASFELSQRAFMELQSPKGPTLGHDPS
jgi:hypothetical protein